MNDDKFIKEIRVNQCAIGKLHRRIESSCVARAFDGKGKELKEFKPHDHYFNDNKLEVDYPSVKTPWFKQYLPTFYNKFYLPLKFKIINKLYAWQHG